MEGKPAARRRKTDKGSVVARSPSRVFLLLVGACAVVALGLGIFIGATGGGILRPLGTVGAVGASFALPQRPVHRWLGWVAALSACVVGSIGATGTRLAAYVGLLAGLIVATQHVARRATALGEAATARSGYTSAWTTFNVVVEREIARARRLDLPLSIGSIALSTSGRPPRGHHRTLERIAQALKPHLRRTDALGVSLSRRLILLLPGTTEAQAEQAIHRLAPVLHSTEEPTLLIGTASFPKHGVTWEQLLDVCRHREHPLRVQSLQTSNHLEVG